MRTLIILCMLILNITYTLAQNDIPISGDEPSQQQSLHQYIVREAFKLLVKSYPALANSEMATYVGIDETSNPWDKSWGAGKIVSGAWIEDEYDIVYHYGIGNVPSFNQWYAELYAALFSSGDREAFTSITHFWDADGGLNQSTGLSDYVGDLDIYWSFSCENAMQKMYKYLYGDFDNRYLYQGTVYWAQCEGQISLGNDMRMDNLFELYNTTKQASCVQYLDIAGSWVPTDCPVWDYPVQYVYEQLGRMCHLLGDMSVPAHVHNNSHACSDGMYCEEYENNAPYYHRWTADEIYAQGKTFIDPYNSWSDPLYYLMYFMNQITDHYASGKTNGDDNYDVNCPGLSEIFPSLGLPVLTNQINDTNLRAMHDILFPLVIRATAGMLYWFANETGQISSITTKNNFENGIIKVGVDITPIQRSSPYLFGTVAGQTVNLEAQNQLYSNYERVWNTSGDPLSISKWQKQAGSTITDLPNGGNISFSFEVTPDDDNSAYIANLKKNYCIDQTHITEFDGNQTEQNTAWIVEKNSGDITAPNSKSINGKNYKYVWWTDNYTSTNPRTVTPNDNETYTALYKYPHHSNQTNAYINPGQRRFVQTPDGVKHICYESMGKVWYELSTDGGSTWIIGNGGKALSSAASKNPAMSFYANQVGIV